MSGSERPSAVAWTFLVLDILLVIVIFLLAGSIHEKRHNPQKAAESLSNGQAEIKKADEPKKLTTQDLEAEPSVELPPATVEAAPSVELPPATVEAAQQERRRSSEERVKEAETGGESRPKKNGQVQADLSGSQSTGAAVEARPVNEVLQKALGAANREDAGSSGGTDERLKNSEVWLPWQVGSIDAANLKPAGTAEQGDEVKLSDLESPREQSRMDTSPDVTAILLGNVSSPELKAPTPEVKAPTPELKAPTPEVKLPTPEVKLPTPELKAPTPELKAPTPEVKAPTPEVKVPAPEVKAPTPEVKVPAPEVKLDSAGASTSANLADPAMLVRRRLSLASSAIRKCNVEGMITVDITVSPTGRLAHLETAFADSYVSDDSVKCVHNILTALRFEPYSGENVTLKYVY